VRSGGCIEGIKPCLGRPCGIEQCVEGVKGGAALNPSAAAIAQPPPRQCRATAASIPRTAASVRGSRAARAAFPPSPTLTTSPYPMTWDFSLSPAATTRTMTMTTTVQMQRLHPRLLRLLTCTSASTSRKASRSYEGEAYRIF
jgi:hypothetical protein